MRRLFFLVLSLSLLSNAIALAKLPQIAKDFLKTLRDSCYECTRGVVAKNNTGNPVTGDVVFHHPWSLLERSDFDQWITLKKMEPPSQRQTPQNLLSQAIANRDDLYKQFEELEWALDVEPSLKRFNSSPSVLSPSAAAQAPPSPPPLALGPRQTSQTPQPSMDGPLASPVGTPKQPKLTEAQQKRITKQMESIQARLDKFEGIDKVNERPAFLYRTETGAHIQSKFQEQPLFVSTVGTKSTVQNGLPQTKFPVQIADQWYELTMVNPGRYFKDTVPHERVLALARQGKNEVIQIYTPKFVEFNRHLNGWGPSELLEDALHHSKLISKDDWFDDVQQSWIRD